MVYYSISIYGDGEFEETTDATVRSATFATAVARAKEKAKFFVNPRTTTNLMAITPDRNVYLLADYGEQVIKEADNA